MRKRVLIAIGGTGGHIYPAVAIADTFKEHDYLFVTLEIERERKILKNFPYKIRYIPGDRLNPKGLLRFRVQASGFREAYRIIKEYQPDLTLATGSYACVLPALASKAAGVKLYLMEQNSIPGRAIRFLSNLSDRVLLAFPNSRDFFPPWVRDKLEVVGLPVRSGFWEIRETAPWDYTDIPTVLFFAGSQGAEAINKLAKSFLEKVNHLKFDIRIAWITGPKYFEDLSNSQPIPSLKRRGILEIFPFHDRLWELMLKAWLVVARAGASSIWEIGAAARPSILIPFPHAKDNHQELNAKLLASIGGAKTFKEPLDIGYIIDLILGLLSDKTDLKVMRLRLLEEKTFAENPLNRIAEILGLKEGQA